jgi:hypothetical protein
MARQILTRVAEIVKEFNKTILNKFNHKTSNFKEIQEDSRAIVEEVAEAVEEASEEDFRGETAHPDNVNLPYRLTKAAKTLTAPFSTHQALIGLATRMVNSPSSSSSNKITNLEISSGCNQAKITSSSTSPDKTNNNHKAKEEKVLESVAMEKTAAISN